MPYLEETVIKNFNSCVFLSIFLIISIIIIIYVIYGKMNEVNFRMLARWGDPESDATTATYAVEERT